MIITTFFSYKGGAGRSTTCLNTMPFLAEECGASAQRPILLMDTDIESAGLTYLLSSSTDTFMEYDVKRLLTDGYAGKNKFVPVGNLFGLQDNEAIRFLGVYDKSEKRSDIISLGQTRMAELRRAAANENVQVIVFDSPAGDQATAEFAINNSDKIVMCMRPTRQFRIGTFNYLDRKIKNSTIDEYKEVILVPTVVPKDVQIDGKSQLQQAHADVDAYMKRLENSDMINRMFIDDIDMFGINEVTRFKWREEVLHKLDGEQMELDEDEHEAMRRYQRLAESIWR